MGQVATLTISGTSYSVYALTTDPIADAKAYFAAHVNGATWTAANADNGQKKALVTAFRAFERLRWQGTKVDPLQTTKFPRSGLTCDGEALADGTPDRLVEGQFELALLLVSEPDLLATSSNRSDLKRAKAGSAEAEFFKAPANEETRLPTVVHELVSCFLSGDATSIGTGLASGVDVESQFTDTDFERYEGFA